MIPLLEGIDLCFHLASYGMSGAAQLDATKVINVNVDGTRHVIDGCKRFGVGALVYVSTYNVVFAGQTIEGGDETLPYLQDHAHTDHYSRTKCLAEQMVLAANDGNALKTLAIRPAAIYGCECPEGRNGTAWRN